MTEYQKRVAGRDSRETLKDNDSSSHQSDNNIILDVIGGVNKKGRVYGLGHEAAENKSLQDQLQTHEERLRSNEELIRSSQEESLLLRDHLFGFMESFSLGRPSLQHPCPDPHQPPSTDQHNEKDNHVLDDEPGY
ncbi:hypothetical protein SESBI_30411 [Sesbania bispinosa]|nr:hypothetical protein SESBI_30411 [Sesbania bispinosa]